jgi:hypothetical protein
MCQVGMQPIEHPFKSFAMVLENMPAIRYLERSRRSVGGAASIFGRVVAGDHVNARMLAQPSCQGLGSAIRQEFNRLMLFKVNQNRSIDRPF